MENTMDDIEAHQSFRSPPRRRRSTFFERRESIVPQNLTETNDTDLLKKDTESEKRCQQDMSRYYSQLLFEKEQWKKEVNDRKNRYHDLRQQYQMATKAPSRSRMSYSVLSNEDIEFLKAKPTISKLIDSQQKFHKSMKETMALVQRQNELDNVILNYCESRVNQITDYILENSTVPIE